MSFNLLDLAVVAIFVIAVADGLRRGFVPYLTELGALIAGLVLALWLFRPLSELLHHGLAIGLTLAGVGAFMALLALGHGLVAAPVHRGASRAAGHLRSQPRLYRTIGAASAAGIAALVCVLALSVMATLPADSAQVMVRGSLVGSLVSRHTAFVQSPLRDLLVPTPQPTPSILVSEPSSNPGEDAFYRLTFPTDLQLEPAPADEDAMLARINAARAAVGLSPLKTDSSLQQAARAHSEDMYVRHYFSHTTPDGKTPYDRLKELKVQYLTAGENLAFAPDGEQAWQSLMSSPDHRANILNPDFRCVGIGAYKGVGGYEEMFTQDFADCPA